MRVLLHVYPKPVGCIIDGRLHTLEPGVPYDVAEHVPAEQGDGLGTPKDPRTVRVDPEFIGKAIVSELWWAGIVPVKVVREGYGTRFLVEEALVDAERAYVEADRKTFEEYRQIQEERALQGRPPLVPVGRYAEVIERRGIDIRKFGINPVGAPSVEEQAHQASDVASLRAENQTLKLELGQIREMLSDVLQQRNAEPEAPESKRKVKAS